MIIKYNKIQLIYVLDCLKCRTVVLLPIAVQATILLILTKSCRHVKNALYGNVSARCFRVGANQEIVNASVISASQNYFHSQLIALNENNGFVLFPMPSNQRKIFISANGTGLQIMKKILLYTKVQLKVADQNILDPCLKVYLPVSQDQRVELKAGVSVYLALILSLMIWMCSSNKIKWVLLKKFPRNCAKMKNKFNLCGVKLSCVFFLVKYTGWTFQ